MPAAMLLPPIARPTGAAKETTVNTTPASAATRAAVAAAFALLALTAGPTGCGGAASPESSAPLRVTIEPATVVARQNEAATVRVDVPDVPDADLPSHYAFDLDEVVGQIDVTTAPCPVGAGSRACQDWTLTPRAGSVPGTYEVSVKTVGSRAGTGDGSFALTVVLAPAPAYGAAIAASSHTRFLAREPGGFRDAGQTLVLNDRGEVFALGWNSLGQMRLGYVRRDIDPRAAAAGIVEPEVVSEFVAAPLPRARFSAIHASRQRSFAVRDDGSVWLWGGVDVSVAAARPVAGLSGVRAIAPYYFSDYWFVLLGDGRVLLSDLAGRTLPYCEIDSPPIPGACERGEIAPLGDVRALFALEHDDGGERRALFLKNDGSVWFHGIHGAARRTSGLPAIDAVAISNAGVPILLARDGTLWTLDDDDNGMPIAGIDDVTAIAVRRAGSTLLSDAFALRRDGTVWWWRAEPEHSTAPRQVAGLANVVAIADGFAITGDCGGGGALWYIPAGDAPSVERVPGFGEGPGCAASPTVEIGVRVAGAGRIVAEAAALDCAAACRAAVPLGTTVTLHAAPAIGWTLQEWRGDAGCPRWGHHVALSATSNRNCEAVFVEGGERRLSVRVAGEGRVSSAPEGIDCGADCTQSYGISTTVRLSATPARGFEFERFTGHADCEDGTLAMEAVKSCVAVFTPAAAPAAPSGFAANAASPTSVALRWDPAGLAVERYRLERAEASGDFVTIDDAIRGDASGFLDEAARLSTTYTYRLTAINRRGDSPSVSAIATTASGFVLTVSLGGTSGSGSVFSVPGNISCGGGCSETFAPGSTVTLYADGNFARWVGCDSASGNRCTVTMNGARGVDAVFDASAPARWQLKVVKQVEGAVVGTPAGIECGPVCIADYADGTVVTLSGSTQFSGARGCDSSVGRQCTVTMDRSRVVLFEGSGGPGSASYTLTVIVDRDGGFVGTHDGEIGCGAPLSGLRRCSAIYPAGASVGVYAAPLPGATVRLEAWQFDCVSFGGRPEITLTMDRDLTCRALFVSG